MPNNKIILNKVKDPVTKLGQFTHVGFELYFKAQIFTPFLIFSGKLFPGKAELRVTVKSVRRTTSIELVMGYTYSAKYPRALNPSTQVAKKESSS